ncbi:MAG: COG2426 family protein [Minisyncoccales bacterium]
MAELKTLLLAILPFGELRASIPIALKVYNLPIWSAFLFSVIGNLIPPILIILILNPIQKFLSRKSRVMKNFFDWLFKRTALKHKEKFKKLEEFALILLVAIPLPFTGAWTGALCAFLFKIKFKRAIPLIFIGILIAGTIVTVATLGVFELNYLIN